MAFSVMSQRIMATNINVTKCNILSVLYNINCITVILLQHQKYIYLIIYHSIYNNNIVT